MAAVCVPSFPKLPAPPLKRQRSHSSPQLFRLPELKPQATLHLVLRAHHSRARGNTLHSAHPFISARPTTSAAPAQTVPIPSPFAHLPPELLLHVLLLARQDTPTAYALSLTSTYARRLALPALFSTRVLRTPAAAQTFLARVASASQHTPLGALVRALWLTDTGKWAPGLVRAVIAACPHVERLAVTGLARLLPAPDTCAEDAAPLFAADLARPLELTLTGYTPGADVARLRAADPVTFGALAARLRALRLLKLRSLFHARLGGLPGAAPPMADDEGPDASPGAGCLVAAFLAACPRLESLSVPLAQLAGPVLPFGVAPAPAPSEPVFGEELDALQRWLALTAPALKDVALLVDPTGRARVLENDALAQAVGTMTPDELRTLGKRAAKKDDRARVVEWPRNVDAAREAWVAEGV